MIDVSSLIAFSRVWIHENGFGGGCYYCPFSEPNIEGQKELAEEAELFFEYWPPSKPNKNWFNCPRLGLTHVWGKNEPCTDDDWRRWATEELAAIGIVVTDEIFRKATEARIEREWKP